MSASTVDLQVPTSLYTELETLAKEENTEPVAILSQLIKAARQRRAWLDDLAALRTQIAQEGGLQVGSSKEEVVDQLRQTRRDIFEAEYAHLYR